MTFLRLMLSLVSCMAPLWTYCLYFVLCLAFVATVPVLIRSLWDRG